LHYSAAPTPGRTASISIDGPNEESWRSINAIDDLIVEILNTMSHLVIAGLRAMLVPVARCQPWQPITPIRPPGAAF
jgi:hypothetical protein